MFSASVIELHNAPLWYRIPKAPQHKLAMRRLGPGEVHVSVYDLTRGGLLEPDQMARQRALTASAAAHDDEDVAALHHEI